MRVVEAIEYISLLHSDIEVTNIFTNLSTLQTSVRRSPVFFSPGIYFKILLFVRSYSTSLVNCADVQRGLQGLFAFECEGGKKNAFTTDHDLIFLLDYFLVFFVNQQRLPDLEICVYTESSRIKGHNPNHQVT